MWFEEEACVNKQMTINGVMLWPLEAFFQYTHVLSAPSMYSLSIGIKFVSLILFKIRRKLVIVGDGM